MSTFARADIGDIISGVIILLAMFSPLLRKFFGAASSLPDAPDQPDEAEPKEKETNGNSLNVIDLKALREQAAARIADAQARIVAEMQARARQPEADRLHMREDRYAMSSPESSLRPGAPSPVPPVIPGGEMLSRLGDKGLEEVQRRLEQGMTFIQATVGEPTDDRLNARGGEFRAEDTGAPMRTREGVFQGHGLQERQARGSRTKASGKPQPQPTPLEGGAPLKSAPAFHDRAKISPKVTTASMKEALHDRDALRRAIVLSEILGPPKALQQ